MLVLVGGPNFSFDKFAQNIVKIANTWVKVGKKQNCFSLTPPSPGGDTGSAA